MTLYLPPPSSRWFTDYDVADHGVYLYILMHNAFQYFKYLTVRQFAEPEGIKDKMVPAFIRTIQVMIHLVERLKYIDNKGRPNKI